jgi:23S rRNA G2445 N2-methylase RlmL
MLSVLATGQQPSRLQRRGRYTLESMRHPAKMLPAIAAEVIRAYSCPGDLVVDPMCGIGTTLVEAIHEGRSAAGMEYESDFARMAVRNLMLAKSQGAAGTAKIVVGDARTIGQVLGDWAKGRAALVLTSPPYGSSTHGHVWLSEETGCAGVRKANHRYSRDRANLAHHSLPELLEGFGQILAASAGLLRPGGVVAVTVRPIRIKGELIDLPGMVAQVAEQAGLVLTDRLVALLCGLREGRIVSRTSFFQQLETRRAREKGLPACVIQHEDLLIFQRDQDSGTS